MPYDVKKLDVWTGEIDDKVGGLAFKLELLAKATRNRERGPHGHR
jgi:hypothetical protein